MLTNNYLKNLYIQSKRRGMVELDLLIGGFADKHLHKLTLQEANLFEEFLQLDDEFIYRCFLNNAEMHTKFIDIWNKIKLSYKE